MDYKDGVSKGNEMFKFFWKYPAILGKWGNALRKRFVKIIRVQGID